jgi:hypothetical protein
MADKADPNPTDTQRKAEAPRNPATEPPAIEPGPYQQFVEKMQRSQRETERIAELLRAHDEVMKKTDDRLWKLRIERSERKIAESDRVVAKLRNELAGQRPPEAKTSIKAWLQRAVKSHPRGPGELVTAWAQRLWAHAERDGIQSKSKQPWKSIEVRLHEMRREEEAESKRKKKARRSPKGHD